MKRESFTLGNICHFFLYWPIRVFCEDSIPINAIEKQFHAMQNEVQSVIYVSTMVELNYSKRKDPKKLIFLHPRIFPSVVMKR